MTAPAASRTPVPLTLLAASLRFGIVHPLVALDDLLMRGRATVVHGPVGDDRPLMLIQRSAVVSRRAVG